MFKIFATASYQPACYFFLTRSFVYVNKQNLSRPITDILSRFLLCSGSGVPGGTRGTNAPVTKLGDRKYRCSCPSQLDALLCPPPNLTTLPAGCAYFFPGAAGKGLSPLLRGSAVSSTCPSSSALKRKWRRRGWMVEKTSISGCNCSHHQSFLVPLRDCCPSFKKKKQRRKRGSRQGWGCDCSHCWRLFPTPSHCFKKKLLQKKDKEIAVV